MFSRFWSLNPLIKVIKKDYKIEDCYTLSEVSKKFNANPSTVTSVIRKNNIPKRKLGVCICS